MNEDKNPCFAATSTAVRREMTVYRTPKLGRLAVPIHLLNFIACPTGATLLVTYSSVALKITGRNLDQLLDLLVGHRLEAVTVVDPLTYRFNPNDVYVGAIEVVESK